MDYHVARNGQTYGPYSEELVRQYVADGSISAADMARTDAMPNWIPLGQLLGIPPRQPFAPPGAAFPAAPGMAVRVPPDLHWALVLLISILTTGLFYIVWAFVQSTWVRTIDPASRATRDLVFAIVIPILALFVFVPMAIVTGVALNVQHLDALGATSLGIAVLAFLAVIFGAFVFYLKAIFGMRNSLVRYYNSVEPIQLRLSGVMTFFFRVLYLQYHFTRIAEWKRTGFLQS